MRPEIMFQSRILLSIRASSSSTRSPSIENHHDLPIGLFILSKNPVALANQCPLTSIKPSSSTPSFSVHEFDTDALKMSSTPDTTSYDHAGKLEEMGGSQRQLERQQTAGGHVADSTQPSLPVVHRKLANPAPLGLLSFATGIETRLFSTRS